MFKFLIGLLWPDARRDASRARRWFVEKFPGREVAWLELVDRDKDRHVYRLFFNREGGMQVPTPYMVIAVDRASGEVAQSDDPRFFKRNYM
jgi:hypothetical protein